MGRYRIAIAGSVLLFVAAGIAAQRVVVCEELYQEG